VARAQATDLAENAEKLSQSLAASLELKERATTEAREQRENAEKYEVDALDATSKAAKKKAEAENLKASNEFALERSQGQFLVELVAGAVVLLLVPPLLNGAIFHLGITRGVILGIVALVATAISLVIYVATEKFVWFGVVAFLTVGIYIGFATYYSTTGNPKVEPAAAVRTGRPPVLGIFVADTASNLYLGTFPKQGAPSRLIVVPRTQVTDLAIGPLVDRSRARENAVRLALDECRITVETPMTDSAPASSRQACSEAQIEELRSAAGL
jgi:hypothetical protein